MKVVPLEIVKPEPNQSSIERAKKLLDECESGEIKDFFYVKFKTDGSYTTGGSSTLNSKEKIGLLFQLMIDISQATELE